MFEKQVFWKDDFDGEAKGSLHFRSFDLNQFIKKVEKEGDEVVGIKFEGNNLELIIKNKKCQKEQQQVRNEVLLYF